MWKATAIETLHTERKFGAQRRSVSGALYRRSPSTGLLRAILLPRNIALAAVPVAVNAKEELQKGKSALRPSELPIYTENLTKKAAPETVSDEVSAVEEFVGTVRKEFCSLASEVNSLTNKASSIVKENLDASNELLDFLKEEDNILPRSGAIALGGLTGLVFALRGGFFKRLIYMSFGAGGVAALCYPKEAEEYFNDGMVEVRKYGLIGHHLATSILDDLRGTSSDSGSTPAKEEKEKK